MRKTAWLAIFGVILAVVCQGLSRAAEPLRVDAASLAKIPLPVPEDRGERQYLGVETGETFTLPQVKAKLLIVHVFSMYCPFCQADAPHVNELYAMIQKSPALKDKVRIVGLGVGNTSFEVKVYKEKFAVPFPLFSDENFDVQKACSSPIRTPVFIAARVIPGKGLNVLSVDVGKIGQPGRFFKKLAGQVGH
jgi:thiol-disulfide isomerase/thioredoxin